MAHRVLLRRLLRHPSLGALALGATSACHAAPNVEHPAPDAESARALPSAAAAPANRITNGDFSAGIAPWGAHRVGSPSAAPSPEPRLENGALCTTLHGGEELVIGWPTAGRTESFALAAGEEYELSLRASMSGALATKCIVKVGHQLAPYTGAFVADLTSSPVLAPFSARFRPDHADDRAGIAIECRGEPGPLSADVCIDDVSLHS
ncbi:MAG TPA: hypothetical protein VMG12_27925 [Polyangiaceae bacterium]|nr:hypothetical protein [Polyangiaceae bacterium]